MARVGRSYRRFLASTRGVAAVEFAFLFPMLLVLLLASIDAGRAIAINMKVRAASYALDAMANQYLFIYDGDMQQILGATSAVLSPYSSAPLIATLSQIKVSSGGAATVVWSDTLNGTARTQGATVTIPASLATTTAPNNTCKTYPCYLLLAEVSYSYTPMFGHFITGPINFSDKIFLTPRSITCIQRNGNVPASC
jgi:Flp pilus assembly protein TadG